MSLDGRHRYLIARVHESTQLPSVHVVEQVFKQPAVLSECNKFFKVGGPTKLLFLYQPQEVENEHGEMAPVGAPLLKMVTGAESDRLTGTCIYFLRANPEKSVDEASVVTDVMHGEVIGNVLQSFQLLLCECYGPMLRDQAGWGQSSAETRDEFIHNLFRFNDTLEEAVKSSDASVELRMPDRKYDIPNRPAALTAAADDEQLLRHFEDVCVSWCVTTEALLNEGDSAPRRETDEAGPDTELEYWRARMAKFNTVVEQLKCKEGRMVLGVLNAAKSPKLKLWKVTDNYITDALNEAKDNVKYLSTLEKYTEPLYKGTPKQIVESLPGLMNNLKMMLTIARYYSTTERMTGLFVKITNQMIHTCRNHITFNGMKKLWDLQGEPLIQRLEDCLKLNDAYQDQYRFTKDRLMLSPKVKQFDFNENLIFGKFDLFCKRLQKLIDLFTTIHQFTTLAEHNIEGMGSLTEKFEDIVTHFKKKPYDLLDYTKNTFDRDFLEYNVNISELEAQLKGFINSSFENISSTEHALSMLRQFESILQRDTLKADLEGKYTVIFHNYGLDLESVQKIYDRQKHNPPMIRNAPPVAGNIMWSRQLLRRIEEPMRKFKSNKNIMITKESKKIIRTYNRVARALIEFETLWHHAWCRSIEAAKSGLQATLIVRHPKTFNLLVNFDPEILQLMRETKCLQRIGVEVPEAAKMVLLQEDKFKLYYGQLNFVLREHSRVLAKLPLNLRPLMKPTVDELDRKIHPGLISLTWQSMNIDNYIHRIHLSLVRFEEMVNKISDIMENRIESNLGHINKMLLVDMPANETFTLEQFVAMQEKTMKRRIAVLDQKNLEVERAVHDMIEMVKGFPLEAGSVDEREVQQLTTYYETQVFLAYLSSTKLSFSILKNRLAHRDLGIANMLRKKPFFNVEVELNIPNVVMNPNLEEIQDAINRCALQILRCSKRIYVWGTNRDKFDEEDEKSSYNSSLHPKIAQQKEIVKSVLLMTGSIEGTKKQVMDYLSTFQRYSYLWKEDKNAAYVSFVRTNPDLEGFESQLHKYMAVEEELASIDATHQIGCMSLETQPTKYALTVEAFAWKEQYAKNLHAQAKRELEEMTEYMHETEKKLHRSIKVFAPSLTHTRTHTRTHTHTHRAHTHTCTRKPSTS